MKIYFASTVLSTLTNILKGGNEPGFKLLSWQTAEDVQKILLTELGRAD